MGSIVDIFRVKHIVCANSLFFRKSVRTECEDEMTYLSHSRYSRGKECFTELLFPLWAEACHDIIDSFQIFFSNYQMQMVETSSSQSVLVETWFTWIGTEQLDPRTGGILSFII